MTCCDGVDDGTCYDWRTEKCCDGWGNTCPEDDTCCDGTCCDPETEKCCDDKGGINDGYCCGPDDTCCEGNCCAPDQCCIDGECIDDGSECGTCLICEEGWCHPCKCWDIGSELSGSVNGSDAVLCQEVTHTSSISDSDHWIDGASNHGWPSDTIGSYDWTKVAGTNPQTGVFGATNKPSVDWKAPPCTGTVVLNLNADDLPAAMYDECPWSSTRDDGDSDFGDTVNVSLPSGCSDCGTPSSVTPSVYHSDGCELFCNGYFGSFHVFNNVDFHFYYLKTPCYENSDWYAQLDTVESNVEICESCPANPETVCCLGDVSGMTKQEACTQYNKYPHPLLIGDIYTTYFYNNCWCRSCVAVHEQTHMNKDWKEDSLQPEVTSFKNWIAGHAINIDCSNFDSVNCTTALTSAEKAAYDFEWNARVSAAWNANGAQGEGDAEAAERDCYQDIIDALNTKCNTP